jgi:hypothetical protein
MEYQFNYTYDTPVDVTHIRRATSGDAGTYGVEEGVDIIMEHATYTGFSVGQHMLLAGCGEWSGIRRVRQVVDDTHTVFDGQAFDEFSDTGGTLRIYLNNHTFLVYLWATTDETEPRAVLRITPNENGVARFSINSVLKSFPWIQSDKLHAVIASSMSSGYISTENLTSVIFRMLVLDAFDVPDENGDNVFTVRGEWSASDGTAHAAVNGVLPYDHMYASDAASQIDWTTQDFTAFTLGGETAANFLTYGPRAGVQLVAPGEKARLCVLLPDTDEFPGGNEYRIVVFGYMGNIPTELGSSDVFTVAANVSSIAIPAGPAELDALIEPDTPVGDFDFYTVGLASGEVGGAVTEYFKFKVDKRCHKANRRMWWLNKLGGVDGYTFTFREIETSKAKRSLLSRPYRSGSGFDYQRRTYRTEPERGFTATSEAVKPATRRWLVEDLMEASNILTSRGGARYSVVIPQSDGSEAHSTEDRKAQLAVSFGLGSDNLSQEA